MSTKRLRDTLWRKRLAAMQRVWTPASEGDPEAVHRLRVASRRIREALPLELDGARPDRVKRAGRRVRKLTRTLGPVRELDVSMGLLATLDAGHAGIHPAIASVRHSLLEDRKAYHDRAAEYLETLTSAGLVKKLTRALKGRKALARVSSSDGRTSTAADAGDRAWRLVFAARVARRARDLGATIEDAGALYAPDRLHRVRIAAKKLRYALELGQQARVAPWRREIRELKYAQDALGHLHDRVALLSRVRAVQVDRPLVAAGNAPSSDELAFDRLARTLEEEARQYHATFVARRDRLTTLCVAVRQQASRALPLGRLKSTRVAAATLSARRLRPASAG